jgi:hypothetical protein
MSLKVVFCVYNIIEHLRYIMDDPKFVETELKVTASEDLEKQVQEELEEETPEIAISSVLEQQKKKCCGGSCKKEQDED